MSVIGWTILGWTVAGGLLVTNVILIVALLREKRRKSGLGVQASRLGARHAEDVREHGERVMEDTRERLERDAAAGDAAIEEEANRDDDLVDHLRSRGAGSSGGPPEDDG